MTNLFIPVILGTTRQGRMSEPAAKFVVEQVSQWSDKVEAGAPNYHANKPCPEIAAKMGTETEDTVLRVTCSEAGEIEAIPVTESKSI